MQETDLISDSGGNGFLSACLKIEQWIFPYMRLFELVSGCMSCAINRSSFLKLRRLECENTGIFFSQQPRKSSINVVPWSRRFSDLKMPLKMITKINYCYHCHTQYIFKEPLNQLNINQCCAGFFLVKSLLWELTYKDFCMCKVDYIIEVN